MFLSSPLVNDPSMIKKILSVLLLVMVLPGIVVLIYSAWPRDITDVQLPVLAASTSSTTILVHGLGDSPAGWSADMLAQVVEIKGLSTSWQGFALDWNPYAESFLRSAVDGQTLGQSLGAEIADNRQLQSVHLIGHSVGAFVVYGICQQLKQINPNIRVHTTYLDPLSLKGSHDWFYGQRNFGRCADFAEAYVDTDDAVPGSSGPLKHTHVFDVTASKGAGSDINPHYWPVLFYKGLLAAGKAPGMGMAAGTGAGIGKGVDVPAASHTSYPAGIISKINTL